MSNYNISSLFGGFGSSSSSFSSINFSDYHSIKSGAYKKLLKKYYTEQNGQSASKPNKTTDKNNVYTKDTSGLNKIRTEATELKKSAEGLSKNDLWKQKNGDYDKDSIASAVKSFVNDYNDVVDQSAKVSSKDVAQQTGYMTSLSNTMSKALSKVGVTVGTDGKMALDEDTLKNADMKDVKSLFSGTYSYASQVANKASAITSAAVRNTSLYSSNGTYTNNYPGMYNYWA